MSTSRKDYTTSNKEPIDISSGELVLLDYTYKVIANDIVGLLAKEFKKQFATRVLTEKVNAALAPRKISYSYQRLHQLIQRTEGGDTT